jgi:uncharacterized protein YdaU (DUF1376 family)
MYYYRFHIGDYQRDTRHLTNEEDLTYRRLLDLYYDSEKPIPLDTQWVSRRLSVSQEAVIAVLQDFFQHTENGWINQRADIEIAGYHQLQERNALNGKLGGRPRKTQSDPSGNPLESLTNNQEPITSNHIKPLEREKQKRATQLPTDFEPNSDHAKLANELGIVIASEFDKFKDYCTAKGQTYKDWNAAFRNWLRNARSYSRSTPAKPAARHSFKDVDYGESGPI